jgi:hypothetical protein
LKKLTGCAISKTWRLYWCLKGFYVTFLFKELQQEDCKFQKSNGILVKFTVKSLERRNVICKTSERVMLKNDVVYMGLVKIKIQKGRLFISNPQGQAKKKYPLSAYELGRYSGRKLSLKSKMLHGKFAAEDPT